MHQTRPWLHSAAPHQPDQDHQREQIHDHAAVQVQVLVDKTDQRVGVGLVLHRMLECVAPAARLRGNLGQCRDLDLQYLSYDFAHRPKIDNGRKSECLMKTEAR